MFNELGTTATVIHSKKTSDFLSEGTQLEFLWLTEDF